MSDVAYLMSKANMTFDEVMNLPYGIFLSLVEQNTIQDMMQTDEGREILDKIRRFKNPRKHADLDAIRSFKGYRVEEVGEK
jgi:hypothetical protein